MSPERRNRANELYGLSLRLRKFQQIEKLTWPLIAKWWKMKPSILTNAAYGVSASDETRQELDRILRELGH